MGSFKYLKYEAKDLENIVLGNHIHYVFQKNNKMKELYKLILIEDFQSFMKDMNINIQACQIQ